MKISCRRAKATPRRRSRGRPAARSGSTGSSGPARSAAAPSARTARASSARRSTLGADRHVADRGAGDDEAVGVDRVARVGHQDHVARRGDRLGEVGEALLGAQGHARPRSRDRAARRSAARSRPPAPAAGPGCRARSSSGASSGCGPPRSACRRCARGVGPSGLPMPRSMMSWPAARAAAFIALTSANT